MKWTKNLGHEIVDKMTEKETDTLRAKTDRKTSQLLAEIREKESKT